MRKLAFERGRESGDDDKPSAADFQPLDERMVIYSFVGAGHYQPDPSGLLGEASDEEVECPAGRMRIARAQLPMPEVLGVSFEAQQGMIRRPAALDRVVADPSLLLTSVDHQDGGVEIEDQATRGTSVRRHLPQESIVLGPHLGQRRGSHAEQEQTACHRIGIAGQTGQVLKHAVLPEHCAVSIRSSPRDSNASSI